MLNIKITLPQPSLSTSDQMIGHCRKVAKEMKRKILSAYPRYFVEENFFVSFAVVIAESEHPIFADIYWEGAIADSREFSRIALVVKVGLILRDFYSRRRFFVRIVFDDYQKSE